MANCWCEKLLIISPIDSKREQTKCTKVALTRNLVFKSSGTRAPGSENFPSDTDDDNDKHEDEGGLSGGQVAAIVVGAIIMTAILVPLLSVLTCMIYLGGAALFVWICFFVSFSVAVHMIVIKV